MAETERTHWIIPAEEYGRLVDAAEALGAVTQERDALLRQRDVFRDRVAPEIKSLLDNYSTEIAAIRDENAHLWEFVRAYDARHEAACTGDTDTYYAAVERFDAARAALGDTP